MVCETYFRALGCILPFTQPRQTKASQRFHSIVLQMISLCLLSLYFSHCSAGEKKRKFVLSCSGVFTDLQPKAVTAIVHARSPKSCFTTVSTTWRAIVFMNMQMVVVICHSAWEIQLSPGSLTGLNDVIQQEGSTQSNRSPTGHAGLKQEEEKLSIFRPYRLNITAPKIEHCECIKMSSFNQDVVSTMVLENLQKGRPFGSNPSIKLFWDIGTFCAL